MYLQKYLKNKTKYNNLKTHMEIAYFNKIYKFKPSCEEITIISYFWNR
jgi:hypothetical protein